MTVTFSSDGPNVPAIQVTSTNGAWGLTVQTDSGIGIASVSESGVAIGGKSTKHRGVQGESTEQAGVCGTSVKNCGVLGEGTGPDSVGGLFRNLVAGGKAGVFEAGVRIDMSENTPGLVIRSMKQTDWGAGIVLDNNLSPDVAHHGLPYGMYSGNDGSLHVGVSYGFMGWTQCMRIDSQGNLWLTGTLHQNSPGIITADHPLDPANKSLSHATVSSPERKTIYDGVVSLDSNGEAEVTLPPWFEAFTTEFRYQLTALGDSAPNLYIAQEIQDNHFKIAGGVAGMKVCWQVTGIRHDAWARANPFVVEEEKLTEQVGRYYHPEVFGEPGEKAIRYRHAPSQETSEASQRDDHPEPRPIPAPSLWPQE